MFAKILLCISSAILLGHQFVAHHHHEKEEIAVFHYEHDHSDGHQLPPHDIAHIFAFEQDRVFSVKKNVEFVWDCEMILETIVLSNISLPEREYIEIRPPLIIDACNRNSSLRGPPSLC